MMIDIVDIGNMCQLLDGVFSVLTGTSENDTDMGLRISVPSWVFSGTYLQNLRFLADKTDVAGVELLFFIYNGETERLFDSEINEIYGFKDRFTFTAHLPDKLKPEHETLVEKLSPLVRHFIVHPGEKDALKDQARLLGGWMEKYGDASKRRFLIENTSPGSMQALLSHLDDTTGICMDTGHLLTQGENPQAFMTQYYDRIGEIHLHGIDMEKAAVDGRLPDHRPVQPEAAWFRELFPLLKDFTGIINLEVFSWDEASASIQAVRRLSSSFS